jgi:hypothetical protein
LCHALSLFCVIFLVLFCLWPFYSFSLILLLSFSLFVFLSLNASLNVGGICVRRRGGEATKQKKWNKVWEEENETNKERRRDRKMKSEPW